MLDLEKLSIEEKEELVAKIKDNLPLLEEFDSKILKIDEYYNQKFEEEDEKLREELSLDPSISDDSLLLHYEERLKTMKNDLIKDSKIDFLNLKQEIEEKYFEKL